MGINFYSRTFQITPISNLSTHVKFSVNSIYHGNILFSKFPLYVLKSKLTDSSRSDLWVLVVSPYDVYSTVYVRIHRAIYTGRVIYQYLSVGGCLNHLPPSIALCGHTIRTMFFVISAPAPRLTHDTRLNVTPTRRSLEWFTASDIYVLFSHKSFFSDSFLYICCIPVKYWIEKHVCCHFKLRYDVQLKFLEKTG